MTVVEAISVSKILDAMGDDALEVEVVTKNGYGRSSFPARGEAINMARKQFQGSSVKMQTSKLR